jgi:N-methylhydantoinase A
VPSDDGQHSEVPQGRRRFGVDVGGTFTDLVVEFDSGELHLFKTPTTHPDPVEGVLDVLDVAAEALDLPIEALVARGDLVFGTTRAINAILTGTCARTALLVTQGHRDVLSIREGGRTAPFDFTRPFPAPYVPRALTFEIHERVGYDGTVELTLDEDHTRSTLGEIGDASVEAIAVCFLWSIVNPAHEVRVGELIAEELPGLPFTLSHRVNPIVREYRRASAAAIDASLKPLMTGHLQLLESSLREKGLKGDLFVVTSTGALAPAADVAERPILAVNSGPATAPLTGREYARDTEASNTIIVADTGGTSYDVSVVRRGRVARTKDAWIGEPYYGHMTGLPSVDVRSIGSGGGSIAWGDDAGLLHVGPASAGSWPGPACYGRGGEDPTVTDAALVLGFLDPARFLDGAMRLDVRASERAFERALASRLGTSVVGAARDVLDLATQDMVSAIENITLFQGIDPAEAIVLAGGGAGGLNATLVARRLGCNRLVIPDVGSALSATGGLLSAIGGEFTRPVFMTSAAFDYERLRDAIGTLRQECAEFIRRSPAGRERVEIFAELRYASQVWELEVDITDLSFWDGRSLREMRRRFDELHQRLFAVKDTMAPVELVMVVARASVDTRSAALGALRKRSDLWSEAVREVQFVEAGPGIARIHPASCLSVNQRLEGPAIVEGAATTLVLDPGATAVVGRRSLVVSPGASESEEAGIATESVSA